MWKFSKVRLSFFQNHFYFCLLQLNHRVLAIEMDHWNVTPLLGNFGGSAGFYIFLQSPPILRWVFQWLSKYSSHLLKIFCFSVKIGYSSRCLSKAKFPSLNFSVPTLCLEKAQIWDCCCLHCCFWLLFKQKSHPNYIKVTQNNKKDFYKILTE